MKFTKIAPAALMAASLALPIGIAQADTLFIAGTGGGSTKLSDASVERFTKPFSPDMGSTVVQLPYASQPWERPQASADKAAEGIEGAQLQSPEYRPVVAVGLSKGSQVLDEVQRRELAPEGTQFVYIGDPNRKGGLQDRFGLHTPDANKYDTTVVFGEYDGYAEWPDRFTFGLAEANALMGIAYVHTQYGKGGANDPLTRLDEAEVSVEDNPNGTTTTTKRIPTKDLPLTRPIRDTLKTFKLGTDGLDHFDREVRKVIDRGYSRNDKKDEKADVQKPAVSTGLNSSSPTASTSRTASGGVDRTDSGDSDERKSAPERSEGGTDAGDNGDE